MKARTYLSLFLAGFTVLWLASRFQTTPGYMDAEYYYLGGRQLIQGEGFSDPVLWNYLDDPDGLPHPANAYWMPLASLLAGAGLWLAPQGGFGAARFGFIILAALVPVITAALSYQLTGNRNAATVSGLLAIFSGFYLAYLPTTDTFGLNMALGGVFLLAVRGLQSDTGGHTGFKNAIPLLLGILAGLLHLARADGLIWLGAGAVGIFLEWRRQREAFLDLLKPLALLLVGYLVLMGPWFGRNLLVFGTPLSPAGLRSLWLTDYNELFSYPAKNLTASHLIQSGLVEILRIRLWAIGSNLAHLIAVQGQIVLAPLAMIGLWVLRRDLAVQVGAFSWLATFVVMTVLFPFPGVRGGLFHSGSSVQPLLWACVPVGLDWIINLGMKYRNWRPSRARPVFEAGLVGLVILLTVFLFTNRTLGGDFEQTAWDKPHRDYVALEAALLEAGIPNDLSILVNNPVGYFLASDRPSLAIPDGGVDPLLDIADRYGASYLALEENHPEGLDSLYSDPRTQAGLHFLWTIGSSHIFRIDSEPR